MGVSEAVAVILSFAMLSLIVLYAFIYVLPNLTTPTFNLNSGLLSEKLSLYLLRDVNGGYTLVIKNNGQVQSTVEYIVLVSAGEAGPRYLLKPGSTSICSCESVAVSPGEVVRVNCTGGYIPLGVVSSTGRVYTIDPELYTLLIETSIGLPSIPVYYGALVSSMSDLLIYLEDQEAIFEGAVNTSMRLHPLDTPNNPPLHVNLSTNTSILLAGFSWNGTNHTLNLLIIGYYNPGAYILIIDSTNNSLYINLSNRLYTRFRIKIEGFRGDAYFISGQMVWNLNEYPNIYLYGRVILSGVADRVAVYVNWTGGPPVGLDPYVFVGDLDFNRNTEIVFITEDYTIGNSTVVNDRILGLPVVDASTKPVRMVFWNTPIDSSRYSMAVVTIRFFYWDNSLNPLLDNDNRVIVRVGLYDNETKSLVYSVSIGYYELIRYRSVEVLSISWIVKDFLLLIPNTGKTYYIAVEFQDPFYVEGTINDADLIIGIEYVGVMLTARS